MIARNENKTFYQNNIVELNDEALENVLGGWGDSGNWNQCQQDGDWNQCQQNGGYGYDHDGRHCHGLLRVLDCLI